MLKNNYLTKIIFIIILITMLILITGCSNNETGIPNVSDYNLSLTVLDESDDPIGGAIVTLDGTSKTTDSNGVVTFSKPDGAYDYNVTVTGYDTLENTAIIDGNNLNIEVNLSMPKYNINYTITDSDSNPIEGATVTLDSINETTDSNGEATFIKPAGSYDYDIILDGYETISETTVVNGDNISIDHTLIPLEPDEYNITFTITETDPAGNTIEGATVTLEGVDNTTNENGIATFIKPNGTYDYTVNADSYNSKSDTVIVDGDIVSESVSLTKIEYDITFTVTDTGDNAIEGATVSLDGVNKNTDSNGNATFNKPDGTYNYDVTASGYEDVTNSSLTVSSADLTETISLLDAPPAGYIGIYDWEDLDDIRNDLTADYILMNDLDSTTSGYDTLASSSADGNKGWLPIGNDTNKFTGTLDGNNYNINGLNINRPQDDYIGLFGYIESQGILIKDLGLEELNITGNSYVGGLIGYTEGSNSSIENCYTTGNIIGTITIGDSFTGGLIGKSYGTIVDNSYSNVNVTGYSDSIGGLLGSSEGVLSSSGSGSVYDSYATGNVEGGNSVGGLIGYAGNYNEIRRSFSKGNVTGSNNFIGGLIGRAAPCDIFNCYAHGDVISENDNYEVGGLIGKLSGDVTNSYAIGEVFCNVGEYGNDIGGLIGDALGVIYDSFSLYNSQYPIIGYSGNLEGRSTATNATNMQTNHIYTQETNLVGYNDMNVVWDSTIWVFGSDTNPAYPTLYWE